MFHSIHSVLYYIISYYITQYNVFFRMFCFSTPLAINSHIYYSQTSQTSHTPWLSLLETDAMTLNLTNA